MMPPGEYYIGDLCYVMNDRWDEFCVDLEEGEHVMKDGTKVAWYHTAYGDGVYKDEDGNEYWVDAGLIGCIAVGDILDPSPSVDFRRGVGAHIHTFNEPFEVEKIAGIISFGNININTDPVFDDEYDDRDDDGYDDDEIVDDPWDYDE